MSGSMEVINEVAKVFRELIGKNKLPSGDITKFHWDACDVSLHWVDKESIERSIDVFCVPPTSYQPLPLTLAIEGNAWQDHRTNPDGSGTRKWTHWIFDTIVIHSLQEVKKIEKPLLRAYRRISKLSVSDLTSTGTLRPIPR